MSSSFDESAVHLTPDQAERLAGELMGTLLGGEVGLVPEGARLRPGPFGAFCIKRLIGVGGMGEVYEAEQTSPARQVAIKVLRPDVLSPEALKRFEHETRILARLQHPGIAPIFEAGRVQTGAGTTPYFAMELVEGRPLTAFAGDQALGLRERLELFLRVCEAVEHAHRKGVIHRDLKPGNIIVDAAGQPKVMDFGVARATDADVLATTLHTEAGKLIGTLPYMSPEQAGGDPDELDTRSDVYSLGVVLYELLSGRTPYDLKRGRLIPDVVRAIHESEPAPLSSIDRVYRGDIETIVAKALAKEKERRYQSVGELAADLRRYLNDEPIVARRAGRWYYLRKFAQRNRRLVGVGVLAAVAMIGGTVASVTLAVKESKARSALKTAVSESDLRRKQAEQGITTAQAVTRFFEDMIVAASPNRVGRDVTVRAVMDAAAKAIPALHGPLTATNVPLAEAIGSTYTALGDFREAAEMFQRAYEGRLAAWGPDDRDTIDTLLSLICAKRGAGDQDAEALCGEAVEQARAALGEHDPLTLRARILWAGFLNKRGKAAEAHAEIVRVLAPQREAGEEDEIIWRAINDLGLVLIDLGDLEGAEDIFRRNAEAWERTGGPYHPELATSLSNLALVLNEQERFDDAGMTIRRVVELRTATLGPEHTRTLAAKGGLATVLRKQRKFDEAEAMAREVWEGTRAACGEEHPDSLVAFVQLGAVIGDQKRHDEATAIFESALDQSRSIYGEDHAVTLGIMDRLAGSYMRQKRFDEAERTAGRLVELNIELTGEQHVNAMLSMNTLARVLKDAGKFEDAALWWRRTLDVAVATLPPGHWHIELFRANFGSSLGDLGRFEEAEELLLPAAEAHADRADGDPAKSRLFDALARLYEAWGKPEKAAKYRRVPAEAGTPP